MNERDLFIAALQLDDDAKRAAYLDEACAGDSGLRQRVEALMRAFGQAGSFLQQPAVEPVVTLDQPPLEKPGTQIGPYKLLQEIGQGGMGVVYMAEQKEPVERRVALKIIKPGMDTRQVIARFEAERQALAMMDHPNIAKVLDAGTTDSGRPYFVMELVNGIPVTQFCDEQHLTARERLELFIPICQAVQHAHQKGIIHRDIKPSNILVALYDSRPVPKVIDFGVAKATGGRLTDKTMFTGLGQIVGTIEYMSPEQAQRNQLDIDTRSDVYSLGVVLYELLTGDTPFDKKRLRSAAIDELLRIIREEEPPKPSTKLSSNDTLPSVAANRKIEPAKLSALVRGELDWIVMKALEKDRARRYETASLLAADVSHYLNDEAVVACPPSAGYRFRKFARRNKAAIATTGIVAASLVLGLLGTSWQAIRATRAVVAERQAREEADRARQAESEQRTLAEQQRDRAEKNLELANTEQQRAEGNLDLALQSLDAVYLDAIGEEKLLGEPSAKREESEFTSESTWTAPPPLSELERELLKRGLAFYGKFAEQNATASRAFVQTAQAYYRVGLLQTALGDGATAAEAYREAVRRFEQLTNEEPDNAEHFRQLAKTYSGLANALPDWDAAKKVLESSRRAYSKAIELRPDDVWLYLARGKVHQYLIDPRGSVEDYERALQLDPHHIKALQMCASAYSLSRVGEEWQKAVEYAERAVALCPNDPRCQLQLAIVLGRGLVFKPAGINKFPSPTLVLEHYARAIELAPDLLDPYKWRGKFYHVVIGDHRHALDDLNHALKLKPDDNTMLADRASVYLALGELDKALADIGTYIKFHPHDALAQEKMGDIYSRRWNWQAALDAFTRAVEIDPSLWHLFKRRAEAHVNLGHYAQALADLRHSLEIRPNHTSALLWIPAPQLAASPEEFRQGLLGLAGEAIERSPEPASAYADRGALYERLNDYEKAEADFTKAAELAPKSAKAWGRLGDFFMHRENWRSAVDAYAKLAEIDPSNWRVFGGRAVAYMNLESYAQALVDLKRALELDPTQTVVLLWVPAPQLAAAPEEFRQGLLDLAGEAVQRSAQPDREHVIRGILYEGMKDSENAIQEYSQALNINPDSASVYFNRGRLYQALGDYEKARDDWRKALDLTPDDPEMNNNAAWFLATCTDSKVRNPQRAVELAERAVKLQPKIGNYWNTLGVAQYRAEDCQAAVASLQKSIDLGTGGSHDYFFLAMAHWQLGDQEQARQWYDKGAAGMEASGSEDEELIRFRAEAAELLGVETEAKAELEPPRSKETDPQAAPQGASAATEESVKSKE